MVFSIIVAVLVVMLIIFLWNNGARSIREINKIVQRDRSVTDFINQLNRWSIDERSTHGIRIVIIPEIKAFGPYPLYITYEGRRPTNDEIELLCTQMTSPSSPVYRAHKMNMPFEAYYEMCRVMVAQGKSVYHSPSLKFENERKANTTPSTKSLLDKIAIELQEKEVTPKPVERQQSESQPKVRDTREEESVIGRLFLTVILIISSIAIAGFVVNALENKEKNSTSITMQTQVQEEPVNETVRKYQEATKKYYTEREREKQLQEQEKKRKEEEKARIIQEYQNESLTNGAQPYRSRYGANVVYDEYTPHSEIRINAPTDSDVVVVVKYSNGGKVVGHKYAKAGKSIAIHLPNKRTYDVFFYYGRGWCPQKEMKGGCKGGFVLDELFSKDEQPQYLDNQYLTYTLTLQKNGNFTVSGSSESEFFE